jgi:hypothetical protein
MLQQPPDANPRRTPWDRPAEGIPNAEAEHSCADRRKNGDPTVTNIRFTREHEREGLNFVVVGEIELDC